MSFFNVTELDRSSSTLLRVFFNCFALAVSFSNSSELDVSFSNCFALAVSFSNFSELYVSFSNCFALAVSFFNVIELAVFFLRYCILHGFVMLQKWLCFFSLTFFHCLCHFSTFLKWLCLFLTLLHF